MLQLAVFNRIFVEFNYYFARGTWKCCYKNAVNSSALNKAQQTYSILG